MGPCEKDTKVQPKKHLHYRKSHKCRILDSFPRAILQTLTTGNSGFAESLKLSAKGLKHSATPLPRVALGKEPMGNFFSATFLCQAP
jgi:hypothetical protein